jgi:hypothetical protein
MQWFPSTFVEMCKAEGREGMMRALASPAALLVRLDEPGSELEITLGATSTLASQPSREAPSAMAFRTEQGDVHSLVARYAELRNDRQRAQGRAGEVPLDLVDKPCFVVPLRKRVAGESVLSDRITVGRARNHDLVLRHSSVSKFHAWFETRTDGTMFVRDAGSRNHTFADGVPLGEEPVELKPGQRIKFGSVETVFCPGDMLWQLVEKL